MEHSCRLDSEPQAVPAARRFVAEVLRDLASGRPVPDELVADAQLVVSELTANAVLHGEPPLVLRVTIDEDAVLIELQDGSTVAPVRALSGSDSMTGRGLSLVGALAQRWGVHRAEKGKVVWARLRRGTEVGRSGPDHGLDPNLDVDEMLADWPDLPAEEAEGGRISVALGDVPTELLLAAKAHVDNLMREFTLAEAGAVSGRTAALTPDLARLIATVTTRFADARRSIKAQALEAVAAGEDRTRLVLTLPRSAAAAGLDYLSALDEVDDYARAARLLTLESPPEHRAFRRWYVTSLVDQLTATTTEPVGPPPTFERFLLGELATVATAQRIADGAARLQAVTASLASATTVDEVARVAVEEGVVVLGAAAGSLTVSTEESPWLPAAVVLSTGRAIWLESREALQAQFPALVPSEPRTASLCVVPLTVAGRVLAALQFSFDRPRLFDEDDRRFVTALAAQTALAIDRSALYVAAGAARDVAETAAARLLRLHRVTAALAEAGTELAVADAVVAEAAGTLGAEVTALCVIEGGDTLRIIGLGGARSETRERWATFPLAADLPASEAARTATTVVSRDRADMEEKYPQLRGHVTHDGATVSVPVLVRDRALGALSLTFPAGREVDDDEIELLATIGRQCGIALERARLFAAERAAGERSAFLAAAVARLGSSLEPSETLSHLTGVLVPTLADWAVVYLIDGEGHVQLASAAHRDPDLTALLVQTSQPLDVHASDGLAEVLRTGTSVLYDAVPDQLRARAMDRLPGDELAAEFAPTSAIVTPLTARGVIRGALALIRTGGAAYTAEDLVLIEEVSARAAVAVDNAETFRRERDAALTLQRSLLPQRLPTVEGVAFAWRYLPGAEGIHIGGDWYDVIPLEQGRVALVIGDVMGRGLRAAALMGQLRATARAHASTEVGPAEVLARLDTALARLEQDQITTALFALLDPASGLLTVATAGHLPPLLSSQGAAHYLDVEPGPPLGVGAPTYPELRVTLPGDSILLLFTDGLVEDRLLSVDAGMETLRLGVAGAADPEQMCDLALAALGRDTQHDDDTAVLAVGLLQR